MKVAIIGGTGKLGKGLAVRLSAANELLIGSRNETKADAVAEELRAKTGRKIVGGTNRIVAKECDAAVLAIPSLNEVVFLQELRAELGGKLVISPIVPMHIENGVMTYSSSERSAAEEVAAVLKESRVVAAFHNVPAPTMEDSSRRLGFDVLVACDRPDDYKEAAGLIGSVEGLRPLYVGPLTMSKAIESVTPLLLNAAKLNGLRRLSVRFVS